MFLHQQVIGHRGASAYAPENTFAAFEKAKALGCQMIEFDVMLSADGDALVFHDDTLNRTTNGRGVFAQYDAAYLTSLDAGRWFSRKFSGEKIPTLAEVLVWLQVADMTANIEIKPCPGFMEETTVAVLTQLSQHWSPDKALPLVSSFDHDALKLCRSIAPEMPLGVLFDKWQENWLLIATELAAYSVHANRRCLTKARVAEIQQNGYKVCAYTVNRKRQAMKLFDWGVDAIFSDYPDLLL